MPLRIGDYALLGDVQLRHVLPSRCGALRALTPAGAERERVSD
jgi:hypothetical protein